jgi:hypothetical protein
LRELGVSLAKETVRTIRGLLRRLRDADRQQRTGKISGDELERIFDDATDQARHLRPQGILAALDEAIGQRKVSASHQWAILWHALDQPDVIRRIGGWLESPDPDFQDAALQIVREKHLVQFAPNLNPLIESHGPARNAAILAAGKLQCSVNLPALLKLADQHDPGVDWPLVLALKNFPEEGRPFLSRIFQTVHTDEARPEPWGERPLDSNSLTEFVRWNRARDASDLRKKHRVIAAGGLAKLRDTEAISFLLDMLYDPDESGGSYKFYGQSRNAAEAMCDAFGWPIEPRSSTVERVRAITRARFRR